MALAKGTHISSKTGKITPPKSSSTSSSSSSKSSSSSSSSSKKYEDSSGNTYSTHAEAANANTRMGTNPSTQSTTTLSSNKSADILNTTNGINNMTGGISTNPESGISTYANGVAYQPTDTTEEDDTLNSILDEMLARTDSDTANAIGSIKNKYKILSAQQQKINESVNAATQGALFRSGAAQGDAYSQNTYQYQVQQGLNAMQTLDMEQEDAINAARAAQSAGYARVAELKYNQALDAKKRKLDLADKVNEQLAEAAQKAREREVQAQKDEAIMNIYNTGVTDVSGISAALKKSGIPVTASEVSETLKNTGVQDIQRIALQASQNGAPLSVIAAINRARSPIEATLAAGQYTADPLDAQYKRLQIQKMLKDINESGIEGTDAMSILAYAQQYAADGKIPPGLPKGLFGVVAQAAKELPKQKGQIVDTATGVAPTGDTTLSNAMASLGSVVELAKQLKELDQERVGGVIGGTLGKVFGSDDQSRYIDLRSQIVDLLSRARSGAALTPSEEKRYEGMLPSRVSEAFFLGTDSQVRIDNFISNLTSDLDNKTRAKGWSVYGVTTVPTPLGPKTVGDTIVGPNGVSGRVNADGTVTIIE